MKNCTVPLELQQFNKNKARRDGLNSICRECSRLRSRQYYKEHPELHKRNVKNRNRKERAVLKNKVFQYLLEKQCVDCGETDPIVLEFDHVRGEKKYNVSEMVHRGSGWKSIQEEIVKCDVRCANCHRRKTAQQFNYYSYVNGLQALN